MLVVYLREEDIEELNALEDHPLSEFWERLSDFTEIPPGWLFEHGTKAVRDARQGGVTPPPVKYEPDFFFKATEDEEKVGKIEYWGRLRRW
jgi:hypothetical protein